MERLTKYVTPVGMVMTSLNSMKHYMPCVPCRHRAEIKYKNGKGYTEEFSFCGTCEVKVLFNKLKEYEDLEEQGLLLRLPCKVGDTIYRVNAGAKEPVIKMRVLQVHYKQLHKDRIIIRIDAINDNDMGESCYLLEDFGKTVFLTQAEAEQKLKEMDNDNKNQNLN